MGPFPPPAGGRRIGGVWIERKETSMTARTPEEVFAHHGQALGAEDLEDIVADYAEDAILVLQKEVYRGKDGARQVFTQLLGDVPQAQWELDTVFADDVLYLEWKATGGGRKIEDGIDTFIFQDGMIRVQTVVYTVQPA
jgi:ketosteroid isomerase-like protein